jgi:hypothetical protein
VIPTYRVSHLAAYARWKATEGDDLGWLHQAIFASESTEAMSRGTAFHAALEKVMEGEYQTVEAHGYTFAFTCDAELYLPKTREIRKAKDYGGIIVTGQCDGIEGRTIIDHKTVQQFDAEYHLDGWQHKFYLDIFEADRFDWHIWEVSEIDGPKSGEVCSSDGAEKYYEVYAHHLLTQYRYPALEDDCRKLALEFLDFTARMGWNSKAA